MSKTHTLSFFPASSSPCNKLIWDAALQLFTLLHKYRPESKLQKKQRLTKLAEAKAKGESLDTIKRPLSVISGINHVTSLIESDRAKLVVIANDVDPVEVSDFFSFMLASVY